MLREPSQSARQPVAPLKEAKWPDGGENFLLTLILPPADSGHGLRQRSRAAPPFRLRFHPRSARIPESAPNVRRVFGPNRPQTKATELSQRQRPPARQTPACFVSSWQILVYKY